MNNKITPPAQIKLNKSVKCTNCGSTSLKCFIHSNYADAMHFENGNFKFKEFKVMFSFSKITFECRQCSKCFESEFVTQIDEILDFSDS